MFSCLQPTGNRDVPRAVTMKNAVSYHAKLFYVPISFPTHIISCRRNVLPVRYKLMFYKRILDVSLRSVQEIYNKPNWKGEEHVFIRRQA
jgi:hypothetical protein